uniref:Uncharacterized protein n=1 Tax=Meloidogyne enterolobii TaxID=390850 RepID=A0A6V7X994_MELEN|nr:unnamed protein product [Meloidogyne enterolobii]
MLLNFRTILKDQDGLWRYLWGYLRWKEVSSGEDRKKSIGIFTIKRRILTSWPSEVCKNSACGAKKGRKL